MLLCVPSWMGDTGVHTGVSKHLLWRDPQEVVQALRAGLSAAHSSLFLSLTTLYKSKHHSQLKGLPDFPCGQVCQTPCCREFLVGEHGHRNERVRRLFRPEGPDLGMSCGEWAGPCRRPQGWAKSRTSLGLSPEQYRAGPNWPSLFNK